ncbi:hypothetical protein [Caldimonas sp. KR1-144]|uniref:hypothetical protein n=1 Tax=Caldimonas sp. KR1-144 TaxID=3400911 RepID=UPI003C11476C
MDPTPTSHRAAAYDTLYDLALQGPPNTGWLVASAVALVVALVVLWRRRRQRHGLGVRCFFTGASALILLATGFSVWDHQRLQAALREGQTLVVEGALQSYSVQHRAEYNSSTKRYDRSIAESFYVGAVPFGFIRDASVAGYTNSGDEPLNFAQGETLRVHYVEDAPGEFDSRRIVRLERLRLPNPSGR